MQMFVPLGAAITDGRGENPVVSSGSNLIFPFAADAEGAAAFCALRDRGLIDGRWRCRKNGGAKAVSAPSPDAPIVRPVQSRRRMVSCPDRQRRSWLHIRPRSAPAPKPWSEVASGNPCGRLHVFVSSLIVFPLPILRDANADQFGIGQEDIGRQPAVIAVQEGAGDRGRVEYVLVVEHHLPAVLVGEDQRQIDSVYP